MTESQREELLKIEKELSENLGDTFGKDVVDAFEELRKALHKEMDKKETYEGSKVEELDKEIKDIANRINKKIDEVKPDIKGAGFGLVLASWSCGSPTVFLGAGSKGIIKDKLIPFIKKQIEEV